MFPLLLIIPLDEKPPEQGRDLCRLTTVERPTLTLNDTHRILTEIAEIRRQLATDPGPMVTPR